MKSTIESMGGRMLRMLVMGMLVWLGWAATMPVMAAAETMSIGTAADLQLFANRVNGGDLNLDGVLTADIELNKALNDVAGTNWEHWGDDPPSTLVQWTPIGSDTSRYAGTFDGAGYTISGVYINSSSNWQGLFGATLSTFSIKNLGVTASYI